MRKHGPGVAGKLGLTLVALALAGCGGEPAEPVRIGSTAPDFSLPALAGGKVTRASLAGRPLILNFWATWCQPCRREFPVLNDYHRDPRVEVLAVALDDEGEQIVRPFVEREGLAYPIALGDQKLFERFNGFTIPYTLVLDADHTVVNVYRGPAHAEDLERDLERIVGAAEQDPAAVP